MRSNAGRLQFRTIFSFSFYAATTEIIPRHVCSVQH